MKTLKHLIEVFILYLFFGLCKILPPAAASNMGGFLGRSIGPLLPASNIAKRNIAMALPDTYEEKIISDMWDNLGRVMAEYPHTKTIGYDRTRMIVDDKADKIIRGNKPAIFITIHGGNWEITPPALLHHFDRPVHPTYRAPNNPYAANLLDRIRRFDPRVETIAKERSSGRKLMQMMRKNEILGILIDQKYNEGIVAPFFGHEAMTNPVFVQLAQKFDAAIIPVSTHRTASARYDLRVHPPIPTKNKSGENLPLEEVIKTSHLMIEEWIRKEPGAWMWLHRRWPREIYKD